MNNNQNSEKEMIHLVTGIEYPTTTKESLNTHVNSYITTFNKTRKMPSKATVGYQIIKDYINFNENRKPTKAMWIWK